MARFDLLVNPVELQNHLVLLSWIAHSWVLAGLILTQLVWFDQISLLNLFQLNISQVHCLPKIVFRSSWYMQHVSHTISVPLSDFICQIATSVNWQLRSFETPIMQEIEGKIFFFWNFFINFCKSKYSSKNWNCVIFFW